MLLTEKYNDILESEKFEKLSDENKAITSVLLENTAKEMETLIKESNGTMTGDIAQFTPIMMPLVRRVFPKLIANELLGVQPMVMPTGFIYALVNRYVGDGNTKLNPNNKAQIIEVTTPSALNVGDTATSAAGGNGKSSLQR